MNQKSNVIRSVRTAAKSSTAVMNDRKRAAGLRNISQWITDVRGYPELNAEFNVKLQALRADIDGLSEHYKSKLEELNDAKTQKQSTAR